MAQIMLNAVSVIQGIPVDGRLLPIVGNTPSSSIIGVGYGGNGMSNLQLRDPRLAAPNGLTYPVRSVGAFPSINSSIRGLATIGLLRVGSPIV